MVSSIGRRDAAILVQLAALAALMGVAALVAVTGARGGEPSEFVMTRNIWHDSNEELSSIVELTGSPHCGWQSAMFITLGRSRRYVFDPEDVVPPSGRDFLGGRPPRIEVSLPADAEPTGFRHGDREIWLSAAEGHDAIYVVSPKVTQRWPRSGIGCN